ncbi:exodeoxyribonuclease VII large subunit [Hallella colorans]|uniref:Exodeoxyribonuclease 7 large subunit n=1 Tax=Hallella colorans TaxID=1703337 RepID=A0A2U0UBZ3_9BACT|nr:exodeoxyribonuclease VII large subunit [Hallella colorans]PVX55121.1 exodeoxyribonuclease VII large subunit [Hallella colorans]
MQKTTLTLFELNSLVRDVLETTLDSLFWVEAELSEAREVRGHCYMELVQKDIFSATPIARASAKCWKQRWQVLRPKFEGVTGQPLRAGMKVMLQVAVSFHEAYGFAWIVQDIDPTYTMGDMARKRLEIIRQLRQEGVFDMQKELTIPMFAQRVAVISSESAAGYGDFYSQLSNNDYGFKFYPRLFAAVMQGERVEQSVVAALNEINRHVDDFDVVVIIRGGGATADLSGFDTLELAENVANFPLPIITGIGHERDESILDMVSNTRVKTPTAAAAVLIDNLVAVLSCINDYERRVAMRVKQVMDKERRRLDRSAERVPMLFSLVKTRQEAHLDRLMSRMVSLVNHNVSTAGHRLQLASANLLPLVERRLERANNELGRLEFRVKALDPQLILRRGYSITLLDNKAVRHADQLKRGDHIVTRLEHGSVKSVVE